MPNKGTTGAIFIMSLVWRGPWLGIEPGTSHTWSQHSTTRLSRRRLPILLNWNIDWNTIYINLCWFFAGWPVQQREGVCFYRRYHTVHERSAKICYPRTRQIWTRSVLPYRPTNQRCDTNNCFHFSTGSYDTITKYGSIETPGNSATYWLRHTRGTTLRYGVRRKLRRGTNKHSNIPAIWFQNECL